MNIAVSAAGASLASPVFEEFSKTPFLLIVNVETMEYTSIAHDKSGKGSQIALAEMILKHRCEALITGKLEEDVFKILADDHVTRFFGPGLSAEEALMAMERRELKLIRNPEGTDECNENHHELEELQVCSGHQH